MNLPSLRPVLHIMSLLFKTEALSIESISKKLFRLSFIDTAVVCRVYPSGIVPCLELSLLSIIASPDGGKVRVTILPGLPVMLQVKRRGSVEHTLPPSPQLVSLKLAITDGSPPGRVNSLCCNIHKMEEKLNSTL